MAQARKQPDLSGRSNANDVQRARCDSGARKGETVDAGVFPTLAKGESEAPRQESIAAMPGGKPARSGSERQGWFRGIHTYARSAKATIFRGASPGPLPHGGTPRSDLCDGEPLDQPAWAAAMKPAAARGGWGS